MKLGVSKLLSQTHLLCYCVSCDEFCKVQYIIVIESVAVLSSTCFSVPGYLYDHAQGVCFLPLLYTCNNQFTNIIVHSQAHSPQSSNGVLANGVSTICFRDVSYIIAYICNKHSIHKTLKVQTVCS